MVYIDSNIYSHPEAYGLKVVGEIECGGGYEFDTFVVWQNSNGDFVWADDSGCSCPIPFDDITPQDLPIGNARDVLTDIRAWLNKSSDRGEKDGESLINALSAYL